MRPVVPTLASVALGAALLLVLQTLSVSFVPSVDAAGGRVETPTGVAPDRYVYYPGTEELARDEKVRDAY